MDGDEGRVGHGPRGERGMAHHGPPLDPPLFTLSGYINNFGTCNDYIVKTSFEHFRRKRSDVSNKYIDISMRYRYIVESYRIGGFNVDIFDISVTSNFFLFWRID